MQIPTVGSDGSFPFGAKGPIFAGEVLAIVSGSFKRKRLTHIQMRINRLWQFMEKKLQVGGLITSILIHHCDVNSSSFIIDFLITGRCHDHSKVGSPVTPDI